MTESNPKKEILGVNLILKPAESGKVKITIKNISEEFSNKNLESYFVAYMAKAVQEFISKVGE